MIPKQERLLYSTEILIIQTLSKNDGLQSTILLKRFPGIWSIGPCPFICGGCQARLKAQGSDPCLRDTASRRGNLVGVREFKSRPPHHTFF